MDSSTKQKLHEALEMKNEIICVASHELRTPLTSLMLQMEMAKKFMDDHGADAISPKKIQSIINRTHQDVLRLTRLVDDMMDITRINSGKFSINFEYFALEDYLEELKERISYEKINWQINAPVVVRWDKFRIEQVILNLINNAEKHANKSEIDITVSLIGNLVSIKVRDYGPGISPELHKKIFARFARGNAHPVEGMGLGLYISHEIIKHHQGSIVVESSLGKGASFELIIPIT